MIRPTLWESLSQPILVWFYHMTPALLALVPGLVIASWAKSRLRLALRKGSKDFGPAGITGKEMAMLILQKAHFNDVSVLSASGPLATFYDWQRRQLRLSTKLF